MKLDLKLLLKTREDSGLELEMNLAMEGFSAHGTAWLHAHQLHAFAASLTTYPMAASEAVLRGGYWDKAAVRVEQEHFLLAIKPVGNRGELELRAAVAVPDDEGRVMCSASVRTRTEYERVAELARGILELVDGRSQEIRLTFD